MPSHLSPEEAYRELNRQMLAVQSGVVAIGAESLANSIMKPTASAAVGFVEPGGGTPKGVELARPWPRDTRDVLEATHAALGAGAPSAHAFRNIESAYATLLAVAAAPRGSSTSESGVRSPAGSTANASERSVDRSRRMTVQSVTKAPVLPRAPAESAETFDLRCSAVEACAKLRARKAARAAGAGGAAALAAKGGAELPPLLVFAQAPKEPLVSVTSRLLAQQTSLSPLLPQGTHEESSGNGEKPAAFEKRLAAAQESKGATPLLPQGRFESDASFVLRLKTAAACTAIVLPQTKAESDADARSRLGAQKQAPAASLPPFSPNLESREEYDARIAAALPTASSKAVPSRASRFSSRNSRWKSGKLGRNSRASWFGGEDRRSEHGTPAGYTDDGGIWRPPDRTLAESDQDDLLEGSTKGCCCVIS